MLLSLIVPVYNEEYYLRRCLGSLLRQGLERVGDYEIICVDDGSTDSSPVILSRYAQHYPDLIKVYVQRNKGLGPARNTGMLVAQGEYIGFVDSDDFVIEGGYGYVCEHFLEGRPDVVTFLCRTLQSEKDESIAEPPSPEGEISLEGGGTEVYNRLHPSAVWTRMYKRSFLQAHRILFEPIFMEDEIFNLHVFSKNPSVRVVTSNIYRYMKDNGDSLTQTKSRAKLLRQLGDCVYGMGVFNSYVMSGEAKMRDGMKAKINSYLNVFYRELFVVCLTYKEWRNLMKSKNSFPICDMVYPKDSSRLAKLIIAMRNVSGHYYLSYLAVWFIRHYIFEKFLRSRMIES